MTTLAQLDKKLAKLRKEWPGKLATDQEILKRRARALELAREKLMKKQK